MGCKFPASPAPGFIVLCQPCRSRHVNRQAAAEIIEQYFYARIAQGDQSPDRTIVGGGMM